MQFYPANILYERETTMKNEIAIVNPYTPIDIAAKQAEIQASLAQYMSDNQERIQQMADPIILAGYKLRQDNYDLSNPKNDNCDAMIRDIEADRLFTKKRIRNQCIIGGTFIAAPFIAIAAMAIIEKVKAKKEEKRMKDVMACEAMQEFARLHNRIEEPEAK